MKISWYYCRLRTMCLGEIFWRIRRLSWQIYAGLMHKRWQLRCQKGPVSSSRIFQTMDSVNFYGLSDIRPEYVPQNWVNGTILAAEKLLQHRYNYLALGEINLGEEINWNREYKKAINTPLLFGPWMDYRDSKSYGDFKYFWELPRLQHLITLAKAYYLTKEEKYAEEVIKQIDGFVKQSPYLLGVNWIMPMEASIRLVSISWITAFLKQYLKNHPGACGLIEQIVNSHVHFVTKNYAGYSSANNHLVAEAAGIFIAGVCFSHLEKMKTHRRKAYNILLKEISRQHYPDGVNKEQTVHYQIFAFNFFLLAALLAKANNIEFPNQYWEMLEKSADFLAAIADKDCLVPNIGDSDNGKAVPLSETDCNPVQSILATSAILFKRNDFREKAKTFDEVSFWLLGSKAKDQFETPTAETTLPRNKFDQGGYYILNGTNEDKTTVFFDCGPLGFGAIAAHGHADCLSFILHAHDREFFIDPGTYTYVANNPYRNYFRSTAAHNTIVVDGQDQSQMAGPFLWTHKANSFVDKRVSNEQYDEVSGWHNGYQKLQDPVTHRRAIRLHKNKKIIIIDDYLEMRASHKIEQHFHLSPRCRVEKIDDKTWQITNSGQAIELVADDMLRCGIYTGSEDPILGWFSGAYDQKSPAVTLVCQGTFCGNQHFTTKIRLAPLRFGRQYESIPLR